MSTRFATVLLLSLFVSLPCQAQDKQQNGGYMSNKGDALQRLEKFRGDQSRDNLQYHRDKQKNSNSGVGMRFGLQPGMAPGPSSYYRNRPGYQSQSQNQNQNNQKNQSQSLAPAPLMTRPIPEQSGPPPGQNFRRPDGKSSLHNPGAPGETMADKLKVLKGMQAQRAAQWAKEKNIKSSELGIPGQQ
ncbi:MAG: hypothetical protein KC777_10975 [Cyanobacteria bacterium HKST-UBA02]|nr:hypothetical protein [Cyanobacteria bacterium HKST-UBA02]